MKTLKMDKLKVKEKFLHLVDTIAKGSVEITDRGRPVAVLIDYYSYESLLVKAGLKKAREFQLVGSLVEIDDIVIGSEEIAKDFNASIERSVGALGPACRDKRGRKA